MPRTPVKPIPLLCASSVLAALVLAPCPPTAYAETVESPARVSLSEALERLEAQTPDVLAARLQIAQAEAERAAAQQYQNPTLSVDVGNLPIGRTNPSGLSVGQTLTTATRIDQPLVLWGKRRLRIEAAEAGVAAARSDLQETLRQLRSAVKDVFFQAAHDERLLSFVEGNQRRYDDTVSLSQRRFKSGDLAEAELRKIELEQLKYFSDTEEARQALAHSRQLLGRLTGSPVPLAPDSPLAVSDVELPDGDIVDVALQNRPDLAALQKARDQADLALNLARRERLPDISVGVDYTHSQFLVSGDLRNQIGVGFSVPVPLWNQNQAAIAQAEVALRQAETDLAKARLDITQQARDALVQYQSTQRLRHIYENGYLERAQVTLGAAEVAYRSGGASLIELLEAERTYTATQTAYLDALLSARMSLTALEHAIGKDLVAQ
ncbi:MAG: TolC family protein [Deltaproteobacteria bacterium]|nr:TolC family protein [Deltaproteobacteria bacterium]